MTSMNAHYSIRFLRVNDTLTGYSLTTSLILHLPIKFMYYMLTVSLSNVYIDYSPKHSYCLMNPTLLSVRVFVPVRVLDSVRVHMQHMMLRLCVMHLLL